MEIRIRDHPNFGEAGQSIRNLPEHPGYLW